MNIYIGNLSYQTSEEDLQQAFDAYGTVEKTTIIKDRDTGNSKGFGFVIMPNNDEASSAIQALNESDLCGRNIRVNEARPKN